MATSEQRTQQQRSVNRYLHVHGLGDVHLVTNATTEAAAIGSAGHKGLSSTHILLLSVKEHEPFSRTKGSCIFRSRPSWQKAILRLIELALLSFGVPQFLSHQTKLEDYKNSNVLYASFPIRGIDVN